LCSLGWIKKINFLEQLGLVPDSVQLTRESGQAGLEPCVDFEHEKAALTSAAMRNVRVASQWQHQAEKAMPYCSRRSVFHGNVKRAVRRGSNSVFPTIFLFVLEIVNDPCLSRAPATELPFPPGSPHPHLSAKCSTSPARTPLLQCHFPSLARYGTAYCVIP